MHSRIIKVNCNDKLKKLNKINVKNVLLRKNSTFYQPELFILYTGCGIMYATRLFVVFHRNIETP